MSTPRGSGPRKVVTEVAPAGDFWEAEPEHQDYLERVSERLHLPLRPAGLEVAGEEQRGAAQGLIRSESSLRLPGNDNAANSSASSVRANG